jgi:capsular polysaccharide biosynthesis protein
VNLLYFIRLLLKHFVLLVIMPILLAVMAFFLTQNQPKEYESSTRVFTGITTGSSIVSLESSKVDLFSTRTAFDNLINIIKDNSSVYFYTFGECSRSLLNNGTKNAAVFPDPRE